MKMRQFCCALALSIMMGSMASLPPAKAAGPITAEEFKKQAERAGQQVDVKPLHPSQLYQWREGPLAPKSPSIFSWLSSDMAKTLNSIFLLFIAALVLYFLWRSPLFQNLLNGRRKPSPNDEISQTPDALADGLNEPHLSLADILALEDRQKGLRIAVARALVHAARQQGVKLRRSFTARDILARLQQKPHNYRELVRLVHVSEPVLYGGRTIGVADYHTIITAVSPWLKLEGAR